MGNCRTGLKRAVDSDLALIILSLELSVGLVRAMHRLSPPMGIRERTSAPSSGADRVARYRISSLLQYSLVLACTVVLKDASRDSAEARSQD